MNDKEWLKQEAELYDIEYDHEQEIQFIERVGMMVDNGIDEEIARMQAFKTVIK